MKMYRRLRTLGALSMVLLTGCQDLAHSLSWRTQPFVRVPAPLPAGYDDHRHNEVKANGWNFRHVVTCPSKKTPEAHWWMVWPDAENKHKLQLGNASWFKMLFTGTAIRYSDWRKIAAVTPEIAEASRAALGAYPQMVQPELIFKPSEVVKDQQRIRETESAVAVQQAVMSKPPVLELGALPKSGWAKGATDDPPYDPLWHQRGDYSQMEAAKTELRRRTGTAGGGIRIGILDTGYSHEHLLVPKHTLDSRGRPGGDRKGERLGDAINTLACLDGVCPMTTPGESNGKHGMKAISILAGGKFPLVDTAASTRKGKVIPEQLAKEGVELGGAPDAIVVPARVAPWVFSHSTANLAYAIDYTSRVQKCDVLSMSHGGTPSPMWIDAVNAAYDRGTAIFAACADYYNLAPLDLGIIVPSATIYPAACRRVVGVAGVSANGTPYGTSDIKHYPLHFLNPKNWFWMRGSFGSDGAHRDVWHKSIETMNLRTDKAQVDRGGLLRAHPISTFVPNVASAQPPEEKNSFNDRVLNLDWDGTSAATPQAAAAAALWLARHRQEIEGKGLWRDWQKAEAVYIAMLKSAGGRKPGQGATPLELREADLYCGAGTLKAADMLKVTFEDARNTQVENKLKFAAEGINRDFYDGQRSGAAILGWENRFAPYRQRADADIRKEHVTSDPSQLNKALTTIFYNQRVVQQWNIGRLPRRPPCKDAEEKTTDASNPELAEKHRKDPLERRKGWLVRMFNPDEPQIRTEAKAMAIKALTPKP